MGCERGEKDGRGRRGEEGGWLNEKRRTNDDVLVRVLWVMAVGCDGSADDGHS